MNGENGRKISGFHETVIDDCLIKICEPASSFIHSKSKGTVTPNMITTVGLMVGVGSMFALVKNRYLLAFALLWICYWFDCLDGFYARKYKMETEFGDYYDHFRDIFVLGLVIILLFLKLKGIYKVFFVIAVGLSLFLLLQHMGCQELNSDYQKANGSLKPLTNLCPHKTMISLSRIAGCGTFVLVVSFFILILDIQ